MPATKWERRVTYVRVNAPWRRWFRDRTVRRHVQGVDLYLPWSHRLPDYAKARPSYGQNLVHLARALEQRLDGAGGPMCVLDLGANIGDSAAQVMAATSARVLCIEGDPYWSSYLHKNLDANPRAVIEEALLTTDGEAPLGGDSEITRSDATHVVTSEALQSMTTLSVRELRARHPDFDRLRLIKSDTDGFDTTLVPALAQEWSASGPVLFFEFTPTLTRQVAQVDPNAVWNALTALGYTRLAIWDNGGDPMGQLDVSEAAEQAKTLEPKPSHLGYQFWDVAACRADDEAALSAFDELLPQPFSPLGLDRPR